MVVDVSAGTSESLFAEATCASNHCLRQFRGAVVQNLSEVFALELLVFDCH